MEKIHEIFQIFINENKTCCNLIEKLLDDYNYVLRSDSCKNDERTIMLESYIHGSIVIKSKFIYDDKLNKIIEMINITHYKNYKEYKFNFYGINY